LVSGLRGPPFDATKREEGDLEAQDEAKCAVRENPPSFQMLDRLETEPLGEVK